MYSILIRNNMGRGSGTRVVLVPEDGTSEIDMSDHLRGITLVLHQGEVNQAIIDINVREVRVDAKALAMLRAHLHLPEVAEGVKTE